MIVSPASRPKLHTPGGVVGVPYDPATFKVTKEMKEVFDYDGGIVIKSMFNKEEVDRLNRILSTNNLVEENAIGVSDGERNTKLCLWNQPGTDVTGMVARCKKVVNTMEQLLGGEVYHYHTKLMMKDARTGGKHLWHQDYGYWYKNGCLKPDMATVFIPLDPCRKENGCLEVVKGTNRCGRINHDLVHGQTMANQERVDWLCQHYEHVYAEMDPGDALFFHSNLLHRSDKNDSDRRRWCFLVAYNRADNNPVMEHHHPQYTPLHTVDNDAIMTCQNETDFSGKDFLQPHADNDRTVRAVKAGKTTT